MGTHLTGADREHMAKRAAELYKAQPSIRAVAEILRLRPTTTRALIAEGGTTLRHAGHGRNKGQDRGELAARAAKLYASGQGIRQIAEEIDFSYTWTCNLLIDSGVTLRDRRRRTKQNPAASE